MAMEATHSEIRDGAMIMPAAALALLPQGVTLYMLTDSDKGTVTIYAKDPTELPNKDILDAFAQLHADTDWDSYTEPLPAKEGGQ